MTSNSKCTMLSSNAYKKFFRLKDSMVDKRRICNKGNSLCLLQLKKTANYFGDIIRVRGLDGKRIFQGGIEREEKLKEKGRTSAFKEINQSTDSLNVSKSG